jgi:5'(3')-deoxyribonucleotidase
MNNQPHIFLDCDGVLADFDIYAHEYFGMHPRHYEKQMGAEKFWAELEAKGDFYRNLPLMPDANILVDGVRHLKPTILTGCPRGNWAEAQKVAWAGEHFPDIPVITCRSADKRAHAKAGDVLIDDWPQHRHRWIEMGGVFISHFDAETSLAALWAHYPALATP